MWMAEKYVCCHPFHSQQKQQGEKNLQILYSECIIQSSYLRRENTSHIFSIIDK